MLILDENSIYEFTFNIEDIDPNTCITNLMIDDPHITIVKENETVYRIHTSLITEFQTQKLLKYQLIITNSNGISNTYEDFLILQKKLGYGTKINRLNNDILQQIVSREELIYRDMLLTSHYKKNYYELFLSGDTIDSSSGVTYNQDSSYYEVESGSWIIDTVIDDSVSYDTFLAHVEVEDGTNFTLEYSIDNGINWISFNPDENTQTSLNFTKLQLRISFTSVGKIHSLGVLYDKEIFPPEIYSISWDDDEHMCGESYTMTIDASDPNGETLTYDVTCDDPNVIITQDGTHDEQFHVTYPDSESNLTVTYTITVTNQSGLTDQVTEEKISQGQPGERGVISGGDDNTGSIINIINYVVINTLGDAQDFGDLTIEKNEHAATSNGTNQRGVFGGGYDGSNYLNVIDYITIDTLGNASDFGDLTIQKRGLGACSNGINQRGIFGGGYDGINRLNIVDYITINTLGNALDFGDLTNVRLNMGVVSNGTNERGVFCTGYVTYFRNIIDYITINTLGDALDFGDSLIKSNYLGACSNGTNERGVFGGGYTGSAYINALNYITINVLGDAQDFGDLTVGRYGLAATSNGINERGIFNCGLNSSSEILNTIDYITINVLGDAQDFGDTTNKLNRTASTSNT